MRGGGDTDLAALCCVKSRVKRWRTGPQGLPGAAVRQATRCNGVPVRHHSSFLKNIYLESAEFYRGRLNKTYFRLREYILPYFVYFEDEYNLDFFRPYG